MTERKQDHGGMRESVVHAVVAWWNDTMRKDYRTALEDPDERGRRLAELADTLATRIDEEQRDAAMASALATVRKRLERVRDAEPADGSSPLYAGLDRALGEITAMEQEQ